MVRDVARTMTSWGLMAASRALMSRGSERRLNRLILLVGAAGFEPATPSPPDWCANRAALRSALKQSMLYAAAPCGARATPDAAWIESSARGAAQAGAGLRVAGLCQGVQPADVVSSPPYATPVTTTPVTTTPLTTTPVTTTPVTTAPVTTAPVTTTPVTTTPVTTTPLRTELREIGSIEICEILLGNVRFCDFGFGSIGWCGLRLDRRRNGTPLGRTRRQKRRPCNRDHARESNAGQHVPAGQYRRVVVAAAIPTQRFRHLGPVHDRPLCLGRHCPKPSRALFSFGAPMA
jgi:hypothetical protein